MSAENMESKTTIPAPPPREPGYTGSLVAPAVPSDSFHWDPAGKKPRLAALIVILSVSFLLSLFLSSRPSDAGVGDANIQNIPYERGDWKCASEDFSDSGLMSQLGADSYTLRNYVNVRSRQQVQLYVIYRRYGRREFNHNPDQCFPAGGYRVLKRDTALLPYGGKERPVVHMLFDGSHVERTDGKEGVPDATVTYFFASGERTEHVFLKQQMWMAMERFNPNRNGWTLLRLNSPKTTTDADALAGQVDFMKAFGPAIQEVITTDKGNSEPAAL
ncbi:MAG: EpsI family protein [Cytophagales bacterium]|nr:EpsI family protein [Armatimonadota bacterium]